jgi:quercetin dioxygenase-like cupin family protein
MINRSIACACVLTACTLMPAVVPAQQDAATDVLSTEIQAVLNLSGTGTLITGGAILNPREYPPDSDVVEVAVGPGILGTFAGGARRVVSAGDVVVIPAGMLHGWVEIPDHVT